MKKRLEELDPGTAVFIDDRQVGEVRAVYAGGEGKLPEYLTLYCNSRDAELLVPANEVLSLEDRGVILAGPAQSYANLMTFDAASRPGLRRIR
ncbi:MAG: hypothetical protein JOZ59_06190 [Candidatus Eremiobacteraeota bacterium]|nr:hypothetical protein [Candidatus Eremiobacteraeota bacterium]